MFSWISSQPQKRIPQNEHAACLHAQIDCFTCVVIIAANGEIMDSEKEKTMNNCKSGKYTLASVSKGIKIPFSDIPILNCLAKLRI